MAFKARFRKYLSPNEAMVGNYLLAGLFLVFFGAFYFLYANRDQIASAIIRGDFSGLSSYQLAFKDFFTLMTGVIVEAFPFVVLGVGVSVLVQRYMTTERLKKILPNNKVARRGVLSFSGMLMPVCECGNVPVARSLLIRGFSVQESIVFLLAAPSVNLVTILVTLEAFNFNKSVAVARVVATLIIANIAAILVGMLINKDKMLTDDFQAKCDAESKHEHRRGFLRSLDLFKSELWLITRLLFIGAAIAAASQTFIPADTITAIGSSIFLSVVAMLILAFVISICSSVDSFFALAYVNSFSLGAITAFLIAGPMVDIKMIALMRSTFTVRVVALISATVFILSLITGVVLSYVW
mgnify:CR=1 FL=1